MENHGVISSLKPDCKLIIDFVLLVTLDYKQNAYFSHKHTYKKTYLQTGHVDIKMFNNLLYI